MAGLAEGAQEGVDGFIAANSDEDILGGDVFVCVSVRVAEIAEKLFKLMLVPAYLVCQSCNRPDEDGQAYGSG